MDFRDRIRAVLEEKQLSVREVSLRVGSDSMLSKVLNPDKRGGIKSPTIEKVESIARALGVNPAWLAFGESPQVSDAALLEMAQNAVGEIQAGATIEGIRNAVASSLHDQLKLYLAVGVARSNAGGANVRGTAARSPVPTSESGPEEPRTT